MSDRPRPVEHPPDDPARRYWDLWQLEMTFKLAAEYGHSLGTASALAGLSRHLLESEARKLSPVLMLTTN